MRALTEHLGWKLLSLVAAFLLWYLVVGDIEVASSMPIVVQYRNLPADLEITGDHQDRLFLKVRGPVSRVSLDGLSKTTLVIDLSNVHGPGEQTFNVTETELGLPAGVTLVRVVPSQIRLSLEHRVNRSIPVELRYVDGPPAGYRITSQRVYPDKLRVSGPESHVNRLKSLVTDPVDLSRVFGQAEFRVPVFFDDPQVRPEGSSVVTVSVTMEKDATPH